MNRRFFAALAAAAMAVSGLAPCPGSAAAREDPAGHYAAGSAELLLQAGVIVGDGAWLWRLPSPQYQSLSADD